MAIEIGRNKEEKSTTTTIGAEFENHSPNNQKVGKRKTKNGATFSFINKKDIYNNKVLQLRAISELSSPLN